MISIDRNYGGFYVNRSSISFRVCLGFVAMTFWKFEEGIMLEAMARGADALKEGS